MAFASFYFLSKPIKPIEQVKRHEKYHETRDVTMGFLLKSLSMIFHVSSMPIAVKK